MEGRGDIEELKERVKELRCLYDISSIANAHSDDLTQCLTEITGRIAQAWRHADLAIAELKIGEQQYLSGPLPSRTIKMTEEIFLDREIIGMLKVHYPAGKLSLSDFLEEERELLRKIAGEISMICERDRHQKTEEILKRSVQRNDRLSILGEITAGIAHEMNTPLGNILGFAEFILDHSREDQVRRDADKIMQSAIYAREIVKKLMFFSCEMPRQHESVSVNILIRDAIVLLKPSLDSASIQLHFHEDQRNPFARIDPIQITQVIFNLLINAIYASPPQSEIHLSLRSDHQQLSITIRDEGAGIPLEIQSRIFEPFFTTKALGEGSGLGLSVVHGIVRGHNGKIQFSSLPGEGTTFHITLPIHS